MHVVNCKYVSFECCVYCDCRHAVLVGPACVSYKCTQLFIHHTTGNMAHTLLSDQFKYWCDPECLRIDSSQ